MAWFQRRGQDGWVVVCLLLAACVAARSILLGGYLTYLDNPVHLAEIESLARGERWSEIGFYGFPLSTLHSPLCYGLLARLVALGLPAGPLYAFCLMLGYVAPALALYAVVRRELGPWLAGGLAYLVLMESTAIVGVGSALGGMWTYHLGVGLVIVLAARLDRALSEKGHWHEVALLLGLIGLVHSFALVGAALLIVTFVVGALLRRERLGSMLPSLALVGLTAAMASAVYWYPLLTTTTASLSEQQTLAPRRLLSMLLLPVDTIHQLARRPGLGLRGELYMLDALPSLLVVLGGLAGAVVSVRSARAAFLARAGASYALVVVLCLLIAHYRPLPFLGPNPWRLLVVARVGLALACVPLLSLLERRSAARESRARSAMVVAAALACAYFFGLPLRHWESGPMRAALVEAETVWRWIREHASSADGRVYVQDTFYAAPEYRGLNESHLLTLTSQHVGLPQAGAYYGVTPYATARWSRSEFRLLFGQPLGSEGLASRMSQSNSGLLLLYHVGPPERTVAAGLPTFELAFAYGRFSVWRFLRHTNQWVEPLAGDCTLSNVEHRAGRIGFDAACARAPGSVRVKSAWHPWWRVEGEEGEAAARLVRGERDLIGVEGLEQGVQHVTLVWREPVALLWVTAAGWLAIAAWWWVARRRRASEPTPASASAPSA